MPPRPSATERRFVLTLGGVVCGFVTSAEGGDISAPVIREPDGAFVRKRLGPPAPTPIDLGFDLSLDKVVYEWIAQAWAGNAMPRNGSLIELDQSNQARAELTFEHAVIVATTVPAMDAMSKTPCVLSVRLVAAITSRHASSGPAAGVTAKPKKAWLPSNFRLELGELDTKRVSKMEAFTVPTGENGASTFLTSGWSSGKRARRSGRPGTTSSSSKGRTTINTRRTARSSSWPPTRRPSSGG
jgi:hypothetical protein